MPTAETSMASDGLVIGTQSGSNTLYVGEINGDFYQDIVFRTNRGAGVIYGQRM
jgi:hypothetical protein